MSMINCITSFLRLFLVTMICCIKLLIDTEIIDIKNKILQEQNGSFNQWNLGQHLDETVAFGLTVSTRFLFSGLTTRMLPFTPVNKCAKVDKSTNRGVFLQLFNTGFCMKQSLAVCFLFFRLALQYMIKAKC